MFEGEKLLEDHRGYKNFIDQCLAIIVLTWLVGQISIWYALKSRFRRCAIPLIFVAFAALGVGALSVFHIGKLARGVGETHHFGRNPFQVAMSAAQTFSWQRILDAAYAESLMWLACLVVSMLPLALHLTMKRQSDLAI